MMMANSLEGERTAINLKLSDAVKKYLVPTFFRTNSSALKDASFREDLIASEFMEFIGLAMIAVTFALTKTIDTSWVSTLAFGTGTYCYGVGKHASREAIGSDFQLQEIAREKAAREALSGNHWNVRSFFEELFGQPWHTSDSFEMQWSEPEGGFYLSHWRNDVRLTMINFDEESTKRLIEVRAIAKPAHGERLLRLDLFNHNFDTTSEKRCELETEIVGTTLEKLKKEYNFTKGQVVMFVGTNDEKRRAVAEATGFVRKGQMAEWSTDVDKKDVFVLDLRKKEVGVKGN
jgi:hypothetical protein